MQESESFTIDEDMLASVVSLAVAGALSQSRQHLSLWLSAYQSADTELRQAGWFLVGRGCVSLISGEARKPVVVWQEDGTHKDCRVYDDGKPYWHLAALHIINLYVAALTLPVLGVPRIVDVFAHRPAAEQGPARRQAFDLAQAQGGEW